MSTEKQSKPKTITVSDRFEFTTLDGDKRELYMSAGVLHMLVQQCPQHIDSMAGYALNNPLQSTFAMILLADKDSRGRPILSKEENGEKVYFSEDDVKLSVETSEALRKWAGDHVLNFFLKQLRCQAEFLEANMETLQEIQKMAKNLEQLQSGSKA